MYYISRKEDGLAPAWRAKRLGQYKPEEGVKYYVRTRRSAPDMWDFVPVYVGKNGKLVKTDDFSSGWVTSRD